MSTKLLKQLKESPQDTEVHSEVARSFFQQSQSFVSTVQKEYFGIEEKAEVAVTGFFRRIVDFILKYVPGLKPQAEAPVALPIGMALPEGEKAVRKTWQNYAGTQSVQPLEIFKPTSLTELRAILQDAAKVGCPVRAVGSAHSWSDAALTDGFVIETHGLARVIPIDANLLRNPADIDNLCHVEAGITIRELNSILDKQGRALINMGGYDGQTLAGVISTSTHGSGLTLGSFSSMVEALVVVRADGQVLQIEKQDGLSDPAKFAQKYGAERTLIQDNHVFNAHAVGIGCLGIVLEAVIRVIPKYWIAEVRVIRKWADVKALLQAGKILKDNRHVEVLINPYKLKGKDHSCLLTTRNMVPKPDVIKPKPARDVFEEIISSIPGADMVLAFLFNEYPTMSPSLLEESLKALEDKDGYTDISYKVFNIGGANRFKAIVAELAVDLEQHIEAVDALLAAAVHYQTVGVFHSSPVALRYVAASPGFLSMQPRDACMIEIPMLRDVFGSDEILWRYENLMTRQFGARPHWGQRNFLTGSHEMVRKLYPQLDDWMEEFNKFNQEGRFYNEFTDRVGFSSHAPTP